MRITAIISGGEADLQFIESYLKKLEYNYLITADGGLRVADLLAIKPDCIVGDFDTVNPAILHKYLNREDVEIKRFLAEKDFTDTSAAVKQAIDMGSMEIHVLCATGTRLDHTISNIMLLQMILDAGVEGYIVDKNNRIRIIGGKRKRLDIKKTSKYRYVSIIPLSEKVTGVSTKGMKYNVNNLDMYMGRDISMGVSNEVQETMGEILIKEGKALIIESID